MSDVASFYDDGLCIAHVDNKAKEKSPVFERVFVAATLRIGIHLYYCPHDRGVIHYSAPNASFFIYPKVTYPRRASFIKAKEKLVR